MNKIGFLLSFCFSFLVIGSTVAQSWDIYGGEEAGFTVLAPTPFDYHRDTLRNGVAFHYYQLEQRSEEDTLGVLINAWYMKELDVDSVSTYEVSALLDSTINMVCTQNYLTKIYLDHRKLNGLACSFASVIKQNGKKQKIYAVRKNGYTYLIVFSASSLVNHGRDIDRYLGSFRVME